MVRLSRSEFYYAPVGIDVKTLAMMKATDRVFTQYPCYGSRQIAAYLRCKAHYRGSSLRARLMAKVSWWQSTNALKPAPQNIRSIRIY